MKGSPGLSEWMRPRWLRFGKSSSLGPELAINPALLGGILMIAGWNSLAAQTVAATSGSPPSIAVAPLMSPPLELDGELDEWGDGQELSLSSASAYLVTDSALYSGDRDISGTLRFAWDSLYLYAAGRFVDDTLVAGAAWTSDRINLVFDLLNDDHPLSYDGQPPDASRWQLDDFWVYAHVMGDGDPPHPVMRMGADYHGPMPSGEIVARAATGGWTFEMRVPWSELPEARPFIGAVMGLQVFVSDGDGGGELNELMWSARWGWSRESGLAWELWKMGKLVLTGLPLEPR